MPELHLTKTAAAARLIDAAIGMLGRAEDDLAVLAVAGAARKMLAEIKRKRGGQHVQDVMRWGIYCAARDYMDGTLPAEALADENLIRMIKPIAELLKKYEISSPDDVNIGGYIKSDIEYWSEKNITYNFIKHADRDEHAFLDADEIKAWDVVVEACALYRQLMNTSTPTMQAFARKLAD